MFLSQEEMWDRALGGTSFDKQVPHWLGNILFVLAGFICKVCWRYRVDGRETLRAFNKRQGALVIANHVSYLDVAFMYLSARPSQWIRLLGRDTLFQAGNGLGGQVLSRVGAFPIKRDTADRGAIKRAVKHLKNGELVGIMPEGTRRGKSDRDPEIHAGVALMARMAKVPIIPMTVRNVEKIKQKKQRIRFPKVTVEYGKPIILDDFDFVPKADRLEACTWYAMRECFALSQRVSRDEVDMVALFPTGRDYTQVFAEHPIPEHTAEEAIAHYAVSFDEEA